MKYVVVSAYRSMRTELPVKFVATPPLALHQDDSSVVLQLLAALVTTLGI